MSRLNDQTPRVWDAESRSNILSPLVGHTHPVTSVAFSLDGKKIVSGSYDKTLRVWDAESGSSILGPLVGHTDLVTSVAFSPDGKKIVSGSYDQTLRVWDAESRSNILSPLVGHTNSVTSVDFSPDGKKIVSGSYDQTLRVWDAESGSSILGPLVGHTDSVTSVAFSPDGKKIVSGSYDKMLRVWDAESGLIILGPFGGHTNVLLAPDENTIPGSVNKTNVSDSSSPSLVPIPHAVDSFESTLAISLRTTISDDGWVVHLDGNPIIWIPPHLRYSQCAALHDTTLVWFNPNNLPMLVTGLSLAWWLQAATL